MKKEGNAFTRGTNRRAFFKNGAVAAGAATLCGGLMTKTAFAQDEGESPSPGAMSPFLRFLSGLEQVEADLWIQYCAPQ